MRIAFFYGGALLAIMAIIPWRELASADSPFVTVFELAGVKWAAALINFVVLTSAASALNSTSTQQVVICTRLLMIHQIHS